MYLLKIIIKSFFLLSLSLAQGPFNSFGIGNSQKWLSPSQSGIGSIGLTPSFKNDVSLSNPATWSNLKFTHLSLSYNGFESIIGNNISNNSFSNLQSATLIVPIKQKHSLGISLHPYSYQQINLLDSLYNDIYVFEDTISIQKKYEQAGGIMALDLSLSSSLFSGNNFGLTMQLLFGSSRQNKSLVVDQIPYTQNSRLNYSGVNSSFYFIQKMELIDFYFKSTFSLNPLEAIYTELYPFDDTNNNGYHDFTYNFSSGLDFPNPLDVPEEIESRITNIHDKSSIGIGLSRKIINRIHLSAELEKITDKSSFDHNLPNSFNYRIKSNDNYSFGLIWFPSELSFRLIDNFIFRSGIVYNKYYYDEYDKDNSIRIDNKNDITEFGYSVGFGYKFKAVGNQIDISYYSGSRDYPNNIFSEEKLREFQIGISIADIWFIKRRQR